MVGHSQDPEDSSRGFHTSDIGFPNPTEPPQYPMRHIEEYAFSNNYREFAENLYPKYENKIDYVDLFNTPAKFEVQYQEVDADLRFKLFGVLEHQTFVYSALRLAKGQILTCSK